MKLRQLIHVLSFILLSPCLAGAQTASDFQSYILPSPNAMTFQKYVDYPVDLNTGVADISVPLYAIHLKDYTFPLSASFHASGRTASFNFSPLGMNWALQASGMISREVRGRPDAFGNSHLEKLPANLTPQSSNVNDLMAIDQNNVPGTVTNKDSEYDIYTISINGISAKFIRRDNGQIVFLTYSPYKVSFPGSGSAPFILTDDKGFVYTFGTDGSGNGYIEQDQALSAAPSSWCIASIVTPSAGKISFKYGQQLTGSATFLGNRTYTDEVTIKDADSYNSQSLAPPGSGTTTGQAIFNQNYPPGSPLTFTNSGGGDDFSLSYVSEIDFDNGKINFTYSISTNNLTLDKFVVTDLNSNVIRTGHFDYMDLPGTNLFLANNNSKTILDIIFRDNGNNDIEKYSFDYYPGVTGGDQPSFGKTKDWWGYCNASAGTGRNLPWTSIDVANSTGSYTQSTNSPTNVKAPLFSAKLVGMVKTVHLPTGGTADYTYEANQYTNGSGATVEGPGIRIKQILYKDGYGKKVGKNYTYSGGYLVREPSPYDYFTETRRMLLDDAGYNVFNEDFFGSYKFRHYSSEPLTGAAVAYRYPVYYSSVSIYDYSDDNIPNGRTSYSYTSPTTHYQHLPTGIVGGCNNCGFSLGAPSLTNFEAEAFVFDEFTQPMVSNKVIEKYDLPTATYKLVTNTSYNYITLNQVSVPQSTIYKYLETPLSTNTGLGWAFTVMTTTGYLWQPYYIFDKSINVAVQKPNSETSLRYDDNGNLMSTTTNYYYDNLVHVNPTRTATTTSDGRTITNYTNYAQDYASGTTFIDGLVTRNMLSTPIEEVQTSTLSGITKVISGKISTYTGAAVSQILRSEAASPIPQASFKMSNRTVGVLLPSGTPGGFSQDNTYALKLSFNTYDTKNNPLTITPTGNFPIAYQWGYSQVYPVAEIQNALNKNVFYTGFEEGDGNSTVGDSRAGVYSHISTAYSKSLTGLDNGSYILSYWQKSGSTWSIIRNTVAVTAGSYTISLGSGLQVDELRFYPAAAMMKTFTFQPLVGMTSQCDEKDLMSFYEYDGYGRLGVVRDNDKNVLKRICYDLQGVSTNCEIAWNDYQVVNYTKTNCACTAVGQSVPYSVAAHTYYAYSKAAANTLALNYISANGQTYVNSLPSTYCTTIASQNINYTNNVNDVICVTFTNKCTNATFSFTLSAHTSPTIPVALTTLTGAPYDVSIGECSHTRAYNFTIGSNSSGSTTNATFTNLIFTGTTTIYVN